VGDFLWMIIITQGFLPFFKKQKIDYLNLIL